MFSHGGHIWQLVYFSWPAIEHSRRYSNQTCMAQRQRPPSRPTHRECTAGVEVCYPRLPCRLSSYSLAEAKHHEETCKSHIDQLRRRKSVKLDEVKLRHSWRVSVAIELKALDFFPVDFISCHIFFLFFSRRNV